MLLGFRLLPATLRGQMTLVILVAIVAVVTLGELVAPLRNEFFQVEDTDTITDRATMLVDMMARSDAAERAWLLGKASGARFDPMLVELETLQFMISTSPTQSVFERSMAWLFPSDAELPDGGRWVVIDGRRALAIPIDPRSTLLVRRIPSAIATQDFVSPVTYYVLALLTLLVLFSAYAANAVARPIGRIVDELERTDGMTEQRHIEERGAMEVVKLARALNEMRERIRGMVDMRMRMLRGVSHDLRTPLTRLRLRVERLAEEPQRQAMIADIDRIDALVTETLDYLRVDARGEPEEAVDVSSLLRTIQAEFADVGFAIRYEGPDRLVATCRPNSLGRAVTNLCDNAAKFGTSAAIVLSRVEAGIRIDVADDGPGIPIDKRDMVLEPFFKLDAARGADERQGFGLGLSIVADIVKAHGGTLEFHEGTPRGLIVRLLLPVGSSRPH